MKRALITGVTGQDGAYLSELLLENGYEVHGIQRRISISNTSRIDHINSDSFHTHFGDLSDGLMLTRLIGEIKPDEIYNLAAQSHVKISFELPEYTADVDALGTLRLLEAIKCTGLCNKTKFYQASTSELYGLVQEVPQNENTPFYPRSPYACAKLYAYWCTVNYREAYHMFACNGILFNHESPLRGENFITRKVTLAVVKILLGIQDCLYLGNLDARRDWGHARDYVKAQWLILQQDEPEDFVIATGVQHSVRDLCNYAFSHVGITLQWKGEGVEEKGFIANLNINKLPVKYHEYCNLERFKQGRVVVSVNPEYFRPTEVETLLGDATKAKDKLNWIPEISFEQMIKEMVESDLTLIVNE